jgi:hypothetical protein
MKRVENLALAVLLVQGALLFGASSAHALMPPWYYFQKEMAATVGADPCAVVSDLTVLGTGYELDIHVCDASKAAALSTIVSQTKGFGNSAVQVRVLGPDGQVVAPGTLPSTGPEANAVISTALTGNCYFVGTPAGTPFYAVYAEFAKTVVQFWADNIADPNGNVTFVAAAAFKDVLFPGSSQVGFATSPTNAGTCAP